MKYLKSAYCLLALMPCLFQSMMLIPMEGSSGPAWQPGVFRIVFDNVGIARKILGIDAMPGLAFNDPAILESQVLCEVLFKALQETGFFSRDDSFAKALKSKETFESIKKKLENKAQEFASQKIIEVRVEGSDRAPESDSINVCCQWFQNGEGTLQMSASGIKLESLGEAKDFLNVHASLKRRNVMSISFKDESVALHFATARLWRETFSYESLTIPLRQLLLKAAVLTDETLAQEVNKLRLPNGPLYYSYTDYFVHNLTTDLKRNQPIEKHLQEQLASWKSISVENVAPGRDFPCESVEISPLLYEISRGRWSTILACFAKPVYWYSSYNCTCSITSLDDVVVTQEIKDIDLGPLNVKIRRIPTRLGLTTVGAGALGLGLGSWYFYKKYLK